MYTCRYAFVLSDANFERYGITAGDIRRVMVSGSHRTAVLFCFVLFYICFVTHRVLLLLIIDCLSLTAPYFTLLYYTTLYYTILYYTLPYYTLLYYTVLYYTTLYYTILYFTTPYYTTLYYTTHCSHYTILHYTTLYLTLYMVLCCVE